MPDHQRAIDAARQVADEVEDRPRRRQIQPPVPIGCQRASIARDDLVERLDDTDRGCASAAR
jgi:hypothetical protein